MASPRSSGARKSYSCSLLTGLVEIFPTKGFEKKLRISSLKAKKVLRLAVKTDSASLQQVVGALKTKMPNRKAYALPSIVAITDPTLLREAETEQIRQALAVWTAVQYREAKNRRVDE